MIAFRLALRKIVKSWICEVRRKAKVTTQQGGRRITEKTEKMETGQETFRLFRFFRLFRNPL
ncbi:MAG: hypothetical protein ACREAM_26005, partial [Blastocatellia bacterium]